MAKIDRFVSLNKVASLQGAKVEMWKEAWRKHAYFFSLNMVGKVACLWYGGKVPRCHGVKVGKAPRCQVSMVVRREGAKVLW